MVVCPAWRVSSVTSYFVNVQKMGCAYLASPYKIKMQSEGCDGGQPVGGRTGS